MPAWHDDVIHSELMQREMPYRVLLPQNFDKPSRRFPVLYLLHGLFGSFENWTTLADVQSLVPRHQLIIVMPEGGNGWYTDGEKPEDKYESFFLSELIPAIDRQYPTISAASARGIAGLSMGGYGAFKFALKFPTLFDFAASVSGAFEVTRYSDQFPTRAWNEVGPPISRIFGEAKSKTRADNDLHKIICSLTETEIANLPFLYFDCGVDDDFIGANKRFAKRIANVGIRHEFNALSGRHDWEYWNERGRYLVDLAVERLVKPINAKKTVLA